MATNDEFQISTEASKGTQAVFVVIRVIRVLSGACLIVGAVPLVLVFPFLFDSPNASPGLILGVVFSFPLSFFLSAEPYKKSLAKGNLTKALLLGATPLLLIGAYAGIGQAVERLTPDPNAHADATIVGAEHGELFIKTPEKCKPSIFRTQYSIHGTWKFDGAKTSFACDASPFGADSIEITEAMAIPSVESALKGYTKLADSDGSFENYRFSKNERTVAEITKFAAYDGYQASVLHWILSKTPTYRRVSRRLDDTFELTYGIDQQVVNRTDMIEVDRRIAEYVKSIVRRNN